MAECNEKITHHKNKSMYLNLMKYNLNLMIELKICKSGVKLN